MRTLFIPLLLLSIAIGAVSAHATTYDLYFLGGQSNMDGLGYTRELPPAMTSPVAGVFIFHGSSAADRTPGGGVGLWSTLRPGHGFGFSSDGRVNRYSDRFGPELAFAARMLELRPDRRIALIKYSRSGSSIDTAAAKYGCWDPDFEGRDGVNQYDHFLATLRSALAAGDIDGDGMQDTLRPAGILWMQGESDAFFTAEIARRYEGNLKRLMDLIRAALRSDDLPVAIGRISDPGKRTGKTTWTWGDIVREGQAAFVRNDACAALITATDEYGYSDPYHYDSTGYIDLGRRFAEALVSLERK